MSTGGIFKLITNVGVQDKLLMATEYLQERLRKIYRKNIDNEDLIRRAIKNPAELNLDLSFIPDINEIEKSHVTFINGSYKPFIASGFEYNKVQPTGRENERRAIYSV